LSPPKSLASLALGTTQEANEDGVGRAFPPRVMVEPASGDKSGLVFRAEAVMTMMDGVAVEQI
jgi:hypothetical protein